MKTKFLAPFCLKKRSSESGVGWVITRYTALRRDIINSKQIVPIRLCQISYLIERGGRLRRFLSWNGAASHQVTVTVRTDCSQSTPTSARALSLSASVYHLQSISFSLSPSVYHLQSISFSLSASVYHLQSISFSLSPSVYHCSIDIGDGHIPHLIHPVSHSSSQ